MDTKVEGLGLRVTPSGSKTFIFYRFLPKDNESPFKACELKIGKVDGMTIEQARNKAKELNSIVEVEKRDPSLKRKEKESTYDALFNRYINEYAKLHTKTWQDAVYNHNRYFERWRKRSLASIKRQEIQDWVHYLGEEYGKHTANRNFNTMRAVFAWGIRRNAIGGDNPCIGVDRFKVKPRERFIQPGEEYLKFAEAIGEEPNETIRDFFWMCLFTGARKSNVLAMEWNHIDLELMLWHIPETKTGDSQTIPLTTNAIEILRRRKIDEEAHARWVFPSNRKGRTTGVVGHLVSPKKAWTRIMERSGIRDLRIHDLRRTAGSYMAIQGISPTIIGKALGHKSPHSTAIYARLTQDPVRQALESAQEALADPKKLLKPKAKVVKIRRQ